jgi:hypothetical protein
MQDFIIFIALFMLFICAVILAAISFFKYIRLSNLSFRLKNNKKYLYDHNRKGYY